MTDILDLDGWKVVAKYIDGDDYLIEAEYTIPPKACTKCGNIGNLYKHGPKPIYIRDSPIRGRPVRILVHAQRYKCRECNGTFIQPLGGIHQDSRMTSRCVEFIQTQCLRQTFLHIAELIGCDDKTIRNLAGDYIERLNADYKPWLPEWLGIDETQIDGKLRCIITDVVNRVPIDMLPDRDKPSVTSWLWQFKDKRVVKGLAIDMWRPYKDAAQTVFPGLPVIIDKFHVVKMANKAMDEIRISLAKDQDKATGKDWMRRKALLRMRYKNLDEKGRFNLQMWLDNEPEVAMAYHLKESFYDIYDAPTREEAGRRLDAWQESVPARMKRGKKSFAPLLTATRNWREEILSFFDHPVSNGYTEALNGVAKVINRSGRGYSFEVLRARLLFSKVKIQPPVVEEPDRTEVIREIQRKKRSMRATLIAKYGNTCCSCGGVYEDKELLAARTKGPYFDDKPEEALELLCSGCYVRFHTERTREVLIKSPQSEAD